MISKTKLKKFYNNPLFYHTLVRFEKIHATSETSLCLKKYGVLFWVPKKICVHLNLKDNNVWVHAKILENILSITYPNIHGEFLTVELLNRKTNEIRKHERSENYFS